MVNSVNLTTVNGVMVATKIVNKTEAMDTSKMYPNNGSFLLKRPERIGENKYKLTMKLFTPYSSLSKKEMDNLVFTKKSLDMLESQFERLHGVLKRPHSDLHASDIKPKMSDRLKYLHRQLLLNINENTGKVQGIYLSDFDRRKTNDTIADEKKLLRDFFNHVRVNYTFTPLVNSAINYDLTTPPSSPRL